MVIDMLLVKIKIFLILISCFKKIDYNCKIKILRFFFIRDM